MKIVVHNVGEMLPILALRAAHGSDKSRIVEFENGERYEVKVSGSTKDVWPLGDIHAT